MHRRRFLSRAGVAGAVAVEGALAGCLGQIGLGGDEYDVGMTGTEFRPEGITVGVGETVVWENTSTRAHTVTAYEAAIPDEADYFASGGYDDEATAREEWSATRGGAIETDERYEHTFPVPGRYDYVCLPHEEGGMLGTVFVEASEGGGNE